MQFLYPYVLFGLTALVIPVLVHLFNFRRPRRVFFTNVRFLRELQLESRRRSRLKHLIVLLLRLMAYASLVLAFAMPVIRKGATTEIKGKPLLLVYIDNSYSMQSDGGGGLLFEQAVRKATEVAGYYGPSDEFYLITNDFSPRFSRVVNRSDFLELVTTVKYSPASRSADEIFERVSDIRRRYPGRRISFFFLSDFQSSTVRIRDSHPLADAEVFLLPLARASMDNLYLDSVWMDIPVIRPGQIVDFMVRIGNSGDRSAEEIPVTLTMNGREAAVGTVTVPALGKEVARLTTRIASEGIYHGVISIEDNPVVFDDRFYIGTKVTQRRNILALYGDGANPYLSRLFEGDSLFRLDSRPATQIDYASLLRYDIIFCDRLSNVSSALRDALYGFVADGGTLVVIPSGAGIPEQPVNPLLEQLGVARYGAMDTADTRVAMINFDHPVYRRVYSEKPSNLSMPMVFSHYAILPGPTPGEAVIMRLLNDDPLILSCSPGKGMVYLFATPFDDAWSNLFMYAEIFVPPVYNMALYSGVVPPLYYTAGIDKSASISFDGDIGESAFRIRSLADGTEFIPGNRNEPFGSLLFFEDQVTGAGNYQVMLDETEVAPLAFNFSHFESDLRSDDRAALQQWLTEGGYEGFRIVDTAGRSVTEKLQEINEGARLWRYFVMAALFALVAEALLLRFWRKKQAQTT